MKCDLAGFVVLSAIIERVSSKDYCTYICEKINKPLGLKDSNSYVKTEVIPKMAIDCTLGE